MPTDHGALFHRVFGIVAENGKPVLDDQEKAVASTVYPKACEKVEEIDEKDFDKDPATRLDEKIKATLIKFETVLEVCKNSREAKDNFDNDFNESSELSKTIVTKLSETAKDLKDNKASSDKIRGIANAAAAVGGAAAILACPPLAAAGAIACAGGNAVALATTIKENSSVEEKLKKVQVLIKDGKIKYSSMRWLSCPEELKTALDSLVSSSVFQQMAERVETLSTRVINKKNMTEDEFRKHYEEVLDFSMGLMANDHKLIEDYGKELAPSVMTFVFVVCLMNDHNRIVLDCSLKTLRITSGLTGALNAGIIAGQVVGLLSPGVIFQEYFAWLGVAINTLLAVYYFWNADKKPDTELTLKLEEAANKIEGIFSYIEKVHNETKKYKSHDEVAQWKSVLIKELPVDVQRNDIETAIKEYLPEEAKRRIQTLKLPLQEEINWLVRVPKIHSERLLQQEHIEIKGKKCKVGR